jgi:hypothetical protein
MRRERETGIGKIGNEENGKEASSIEIHRISDGL